MIDNAKGRAKDFPRQVIDLAKEGLYLRDQFVAGKVDQPELLRSYEDLTERLATLSYRPRLNADNERLAKHIYRHTGEWFMFLVDPSIPATNYRAEQAEKVPIVNRKVCGGNRTPAGEKAQEVHSSVIGTCTKRAVCSAISFISQALCGLVGSLFSKNTED